MSTVRVPPAYSMPHTRSSKSSRVYTRSGLDIRMVSRSNSWVLNPASLHPPSRCDEQHEYVVIRLQSLGSWSRPAVAYCSSPPDASVPSRGPAIHGFQTVWSYNRLRPSQDRQFCPPVRFDGEQNNTDILPVF